MLRSLHPQMQRSLPIAFGALRWYGIYAARKPLSFAVMARNYGSTSKDSENTPTVSPVQESMVAKTVKVIKEQQQASHSVTESSTVPPPITAESAAKKGKLANLWETIKRELTHLKHGSKLLWTEMKISSKLTYKLAKGQKLTRREHRQLLRTTADMFRLVPFSVFVIVPFLELLLPVALYFFPNMLPSTFESASKKEEERKKRLKVKLEMAKFLQQTVEEMAVAGNAKSDAAKEFSELFRKFRITGEPVSTDEILRVSKRFEDELTLDNLSRPQLVSMARYMGVKAFGTDNYLRYQIRQRMNKLKADDVMIAKEGVDSLTVPELQSACQARGMRSLGTSPARMRSELQQWLDLHLVNKVPSALLILSRAFTIDSQEEGSVNTTEALRATIASLPDTVVNEVEVKTMEVAGGKDTFKEKLEVIEQQEEMIADELLQEQRENEAKKLKADMQEAPVSEVISNKDIQKVTEAIAALSSASLKEREELTELKVDRQEYKQEVQELKEATQNTMNESQAGAALGQRVEKLLASLETELRQYESETPKTPVHLTPDAAGHISVDQLERALHAMQAHPNHERLRAIVKRLDRDGDGKIVLSEVLALEAELAQAEGQGVVLPTQFTTSKNPSDSPSPK